MTVLGAFAFAIVLGYGLALWRYRRDRKRFCDCPEYCAWCHQAFYGW